MDEASNSGSQGNLALTSAIGVTNRIMLQSLLNRKSTTNPATTTTATTRSQSGKATEPTMRASFPLRSLASLVVATWCDSVNATMRFSKTKGVLPFPQIRPSTPF